MRPACRACDSNGRHNDEAEILALQRARWHQRWKSGGWLRDAEDT